MQQFKRAQVVLVPTKEQTTIIKPNNNKLMLSKNWGHHDYSKVDIQRFIDIGFEPQQLCIITDEPIDEKKDLFLFGDSLIVQADSYSNGRFYSNNNQNVYIEEKCKKIIASHPPLKREDRNAAEVGYPYSTLYPEPSQQFIEKYIESYNNQEVITNVLVEYENLVEDMYSNRHLQRENDSQQYLNTCKLISSTIKVNPKDNTISIRKLKYNWNRREVKDLLWKAFTSNCPKMSPSQIKRELMPAFNRFLDEHLYL